MDFSNFSDDPFEDFADILAQSEDKLSVSKYSKSARPRTASSRKREAKSASRSMSMIQSRNESSLASGMQQHTTSKPSNEPNYRDQRGTSMRGVYSVASERAQVEKSNTTGSQNSSLYELELANQTDSNNFSSRNLHVEKVEQDGFDGSEYDIQGTGKLETLSEVSERLSFEWQDQEVDSKSVDKLDSEQRGAKDNDKQDESEVNYDEKAESPLGALYDYNDDASPIHSDAIKRDYEVFEHEESPSNLGSMLNIVTNVDELHDSHYSRTPANIKDENPGLKASERAEHFRRLDSVSDIAASERNAQTKERSTMGDEEGYVDKMFEMKRRISKLNQKEENLDNLIKRFEDGISILSKISDRLDDKEQKIASNVAEVSMMPTTDTKNQKHVFDFEFDDQRLKQMIQNYVIEIVSNNTSNNNNNNNNNNNTTTLNGTPSRVVQNSEIKSNENTNKQAIDDIDEYQRLERFYKCRLERFNMIIATNSIDADRLSFHNSSSEWLETEIKLSASKASNVHCGQKIKQELEHSWIEYRANSLQDSIRFARRQLDWSSRSNNKFGVDS